MTESHVPIELIVADDSDERPRLEPNSRIDVLINGRTYPTVELTDGRYVAWWFDADAPDPHDSVTTEWVAAPTRFLAAATLRELWENPIAFESLRSDAAGDLSPTRLPSTSGE